MRNSLRMPAYMWQALFFSRASPICGQIYKEYCLVMQLTNAHSLYLSNLNVKYIIIKKLSNLCLIFISYISYLILLLYSYKYVLIFTSELTRKVFKLTSLKKIKIKKPVWLSVIS